MREQGEGAKGRATGGFKGATDAGSADPPKLVRIKIRGQIRI